MEPLGKIMIRMEDERRTILLLSSLPLLKAAPESSDVDTEGSGSSFDTEPETRKKRPLSRGR